MNYFQKDYWCSCVSFETTTTKEKVYNHTHSLLVILSDFVIIFMLCKIDYENIIFRIITYTSSSNPKLYGLQYGLFTMWS